MTKKVNLLLRGKQLRPVNIQYLSRLHKEQQTQAKNSF